MAGPDDVVSMPLTDREVGQQMREYARLFAERTRIEQEMEEIREWLQENLGTSLAEPYCVQTRDGEAVYSTRRLPSTVNAAALIQAGFRKEQFGEYRATVKGLRSMAQKLAWEEQMVERFLTPGEPRGYIRIVKAQEESDER